MFACCSRPVVDQAEEAFSSLGSHRLSEKSCPSEFSPNAANNSFYSALDVIDTGDIPKLQPGFTKTCSTFKWKDGVPTEVQVRGRGYKSTQKKVFSLQSYYATIAMDVFNCSKVDTFDIFNYISLPNLPKNASGLPPYLVLEILLPQTRNKPTPVVVLYHQLREDFPQNKGIKLLRKFIKTRDSTRNFPLKCIIHVDDERFFKNVKEPNRLIHRWNGKPALITKSCSFRYYNENEKLTEKGDYIVCFRIDVNQWSFIVKQLYQRLSSTVVDRSLHLAFLIEANHDADLPENLISATCVESLEFESAYSV